MNLAFWRNHDEPTAPASNQKEKTVVVDTSLELPSQQEIVESIDYAFRALKEDPRYAEYADMIAGIVIFGSSMAADGLNFESESDIDLMLLTRNDEGLDKAEEIGRILRGMLPPKVQTRVPDNHPFQLVTKMAAHQEGEEFKSVFKRNTFEDVVAVCDDADLTTIASMFNPAKA